MVLSPRFGRPKAGSHITLTGRRAKYLSDRRQSVQVELTLFVEIVYVRSLTRQALARRRWKREIGIQLAAAAGPIRKHVRKGPSSENFLDSATLWGIWLTLAGSWLHCQLG